MDIVITDLTKSFGEQPVLDGFSAVFRAGETTCIMGPSGCGKTTLLNILMGLLEPDSGTVAGVPKRMSAVFQEDRLCESFSAVTNVRLACGKDAQADMISAQLEALDLRDYFAKPVREFSGGMKRRVALVRAIMAKGDILFLDEPFGGLDDETKKTAVNYVKDNIRARTVIMVTHDIEAAAAMGGRIFRMRG